MLIKLKIILGFLLCVIRFNYAGDTLRVMSYNILNYPNPACVDDQQRVDQLRTIIAESGPDVLMVCELLTAEGVDLILQKALNIESKNTYQAAAFEDGPDSDNMLFFNKDKLSLISQTQIKTEPRWISHYLLYYNKLNDNDTIFLNMFIVHLKAQDSPEDQNRRFAAASLLRDYIDNNTRGENIFIGGDFNVYSSNEKAYQKLINDGICKIVDPLNSPGNWHSNETFSRIHTQSTRKWPFGCSVGSGGMDDRFDFILTSGDIMNGKNSLTYIPGTYTAYGNDGMHYNKSINDPENPTLPSEVVNALYQMSDHLPVLMHVTVEPPLGIPDVTNNNIRIRNAGSSVISIQFANANGEKLEISLYTIEGRLVKKQKYDLEQPEIQMDFGGVSNGVYLIEVRSNSYKFTKKIAFL